MLENMIDCVEASKELGCNPANVRKYSQRGYFPSYQSGKKKLFSREDIQAFRKRKQAHDELGARVMEFFVLLREGVAENDIREYCPETNQIRLAVQHYEEQRKWNLGEVSRDALLLREIMARLKLKSKVPVYELVKEGKLKRVGLTFYSLESLKAFLGSRVGKPLYISREAAALINTQNKRCIGIKDIDMIANRDKIGMKLRESVLMSTYLFTREEIDSIRGEFNNNYNSYNRFVSRK